MGRLKNWFMATHCSAEGRELAMRAEKTRRLFELGGFHSQPTVRHIVARARDLREESSKTLKKKGVTEVNDLWERNGIIRYAIYRAVELIEIAVGAFIVYKIAKEEPNKIGFAEGIVIAALAIVAVVNEFLLRSMRRMLVAAYDLYFANRVIQEFEEDGRQPRLKNKEKRQPI